MVVVGTITRNFLTLVQTKISAQGNMIQLGVGQGCRVGASIGHVWGFGVNCGEYCMPAEAGIWLRWCLNKDAHDILPSKHAFQLCSPPPLGVASPLAPPAGTQILRGSSLTGGWTTARPFAPDCHQRWKKHHWAKAPSYIFLEMWISGKCNALNNIVSLVTTIWGTQPNDPSEKCLLASASWVASGKKSETQQKSYSSERRCLNPRAKQFLAEVVQEREGGQTQGEPPSCQALEVVLMPWWVMALHHVCTALHSLNKDRTSLGQILLLHRVIHRCELHAVLLWI